MVRHILAAVAALVLVGAVLAGDPRTVIIPIGTDPFSAGEKDTVRLTGKGIAGSKIDAQVTGPAKVVAENYIVEKKGNANVIGNHIAEYELVATGKGMVKVTITVKRPNGPATTTTYQYEVK
jgi:hypothetical protein